MEFCEVVLVRHGETDWNRVSRLQGNVDIPLNDRGREQCKEAAQKLITVFNQTVQCLQNPEKGPNPNEAGIYAIYTSPLSRAIESAELISNGLGLPKDAITSEADLREWDAGIMKGSLLSEISTKFPKCWDAWRINRDPHFQFEGGESFAQRMSRVEAAVQRIADANPGRRILIVTHAGVIDDVFRRAKRVPLKNSTHVQKLNAEVYIVHVHVNDQNIKCPRWRILRWGPRTINHDRRSSLQFDELERNADDFKTEYA